MKNVNYQVMVEAQKNRDGKYIPNYAELIKNASCAEEVEYIKGVESWRSYKGEAHSFVFNMVYVMKQKCGHFEIFQTPKNAYYTIDTVLAQAEEYAKKSNCTHCVCGRG